MANNTLTWADFIPLIATYGIPLAESLFQKWSSGAAPTQADFDALKAMATQSATDQMKAQLIAAGIALADPHAIALLNLTLPPPATPRPGTPAAPVAEVAPPVNPPTTPLIAPN